MHNPNQNTKGVKIGVVLTDPEDELRVHSWRIGLLTIAYFLKRKK